MRPGPGMIQQSRPVAAERFASEAEPLPFQHPAGQVPFRRGRLKG